MPEGHKSIAPNKLARHSGFLARVKFKITFKAEDIVIDGGYGFARFTALTDMQNPETGALIQKRSRDFFVFRKEQTHWKIFRYMFNDVKEI